MKNTTEIGGHLDLSQNIRIPLFLRMADSGNDPSLAYEAIPFSLEEYASMKTLFLSAFEVEMKRDNFIKRFDTRLLGSSVIGYLAKHRETGEPAAYYGVFPVKITVNNNVLLVAQSGDTMTHQHHQKKGLFTWLAKKTFATCKEKGIALIFGIPNKNSYPGFIRRLEWKQLDRINTYDLKLKVKTFPLPKLCIKWKLPRTYLRFARLVFRRKIVSDVTEFQNPLMAYSRVYRDQAYLHYKETPDKLFIKINDVVVWIRLTDVLWIGDFSTYEKVTPTTIKKLKYLAWVLGYNTIRFHFNDSLPKPLFLSHFKLSGQEPSCFLYLDESLEGTNLLLTAADFDTW
ncbi:MAG: GNAT family N-acetyltransferase [Flavobacterium sp.]|nr:MAG: GNAT family N-acetyltransferase [Flavobacterium sp.]